MESLMLPVGVILMLVVAIGILLYVTLVIAIPVVRLIDWLFDREDPECTGRPVAPRAPRRRGHWLGRLSGHAPSGPRPDGEEG